MAASTRSRRRKNVEQPAHAAAAKLETPSFEASPKLRTAYAYVDAVLDVAGGMDAFSKRRQDLLTGKRPRARELFEAYFIAYADALGDDFGAKDALLIVQEYLTARTHNPTQGVQDFLEDFFNPNATAARLEVTPRPGGADDLPGQLYFAAMGEDEEAPAPPPPPPVVPLSRIELPPQPAAAVAPAEPEEAAEEPDQSTEDAEVDEAAAADSDEDALIGDLDDTGIEVIRKEATQAAERAAQKFLQSGKTAGRLWPQNTLVKCRFSAGWLIGTLVQDNGNGTLLIQRDTQAEEPHWLVAKNLCKRIKAKPVVALEAAPVVPQVSLVLAEEDILRLTAWLAQDMVDGQEPDAVLAVFAGEPICPGEPDEAVPLFELHNGTNGKTRPYVSLLLLQTSDECVLFEHPPVTTVEGTYRLAHRGLPVDFVVTSGDVAACLDVETTS